jgi:uncharacterized protein YwgA
MGQTSRLFSSLYALGIDPRMNTFAERKQIQKLVYLLDKVFGMDFHFSYSWYLHGPYSPEVTRIIFDVIEHRQNVDSNNLILPREDLRRIERLKSFLGKDINSNDQLELLASVSFLLQYPNDPKITQEDIVTFLKAKKPYFDDDQIREAIKRLQTLINE